jgi:hypothetical protein
VVTELGLLAPEEKQSAAKFIIWFAQVSRDLNTL